MNFAFSEEQEQLREFVRQFLENYSPETAVRELKIGRASCRERVYVTV